MFSGGSFPGDLPDCLRGGLPSGWVSGCLRGFALPVGFRLDVFVAGSKDRVFRARGLYFCERAEDGFWWFARQLSLGACLLVKLGCSPGVVFRGGLPDCLRGGFCRPVGFRVI